MKPEQISWTDTQWAAYLGCAAADVEKYRNWLTKNYVPSVVKNVGAKQFYGLVVRRHDTPSGAPRFIPMVSTQQAFKTSEDARVYVNETMIPAMELTAFWADAYKVPQKVLQMMHIEKQK